MKDLISRSYDAIRKRGLISADTDGHDFIKKMEEEKYFIYSTASRSIAIATVFRILDKE